MHFTSIFLILIRLILIHMIQATIEYNLYSILSEDYTLVLFSIHFAFLRSIFYCILLLLILLTFNLHSYPLYTHKFLEEYMILSYYIASLQFSNHFPYNTTQKPLQSSSPQHWCIDLQLNYNIINGNPLTNTSLKYKCRFYISYLMPGLTINLS